MGNGRIGVAQKKCTLCRSPADHASFGDYYFGGWFYLDSSGCRGGGYGRCFGHSCGFFNNNRRGNGGSGQDGRFGLRLGGNGRFRRRCTGRY